MDKTPDREGSESDAANARLVGSVTEVVFANAETGFVVLKIDPEDGYGDPEPGAWLVGAPSSAVGRLAGARAGLRVSLEGRWSTHRSYGRRFEFEIAQMLAPTDRQGLVRYLASGNFAGVGLVLAGRIVDKLGEQALERIRSDARALVGIPGVRKKVREELAREVRDEFTRHEREAFLRGLGLTAAQSHAIGERFGEDSAVLVRRDPYALVEAIPGVGFTTADRIAQTLGLPSDSAERAAAALAHALSAAMNEGHSFLPQSELMVRAHELLRTGGSATQVPSPQLDAGLSLLAARRQIAIEARADPAVFLARLHRNECELARRLAALAGASDVAPLAVADELLCAERESGLALDPEQRDAVLGLLSRPISLLTGGPGVGKTTIVRLIVELAERAEASVLLASPTGRAARRLSETTGRPASTLHRLLAFNPRTGWFAHGPDRPVEADLVIVDELSMLDLALATRLFAALRSPTRAILVGDPDQLPSVGPGNVLADLIASARVPVFRLTHIYRQERGGRIVENAHRMLLGQLPLLPARGDLSSDFYFFPAEDPAECARLLVDVVTERIPKSFGLDWERDVQVLAPMYRGECGVDALNDFLRERSSAHGPTGMYGEVRGNSWLVGDRVIQTRNDYEKEIFNGDMGHVARLEQDGSIWVQFVDRRVRFGVDERTDLSLAFAITVHRAQGSEYPAVVMPLVRQHSVMLQRNLFYTAVTRARRLFVVVGSRSALELAIGNAQAARRNSLVKERLQLLLPELPGRAL